MGCGCKNSAQTTQTAVQTPQREVVGGKPQSEPEKVVVVSDNNPAPKVVVKGVCDELYSELSILDGKVYDLFIRTRLDGTGDDFEWLQIQRQIRGWKKELNERCPDADLLQFARNLINEEYSKLFI